MKTFLLLIVILFDMGTMTWCRCRYKHSEMIDDGCTKCRGLKLLITCEDGVWVESECGNSTICHTGRVNCGSFCGIDLFQF